MLILLNTKQAKYEKRNTINDAVHVFLKLKYLSKFFIYQLKVRNSKVEK